MPGVPNASRIVLFSPGQAEIGGAARRSRVISEGLAARGWDVRCITRAATFRRPSVRRSDSLIIVEVPGFDRPVVGALLYYLVAVVLGLWWGRRATVLLAVQLYSTGLVATLCGALWRKPVIALATGSGLLGESAVLPTRPLARLRLWLLRRATLAVQTQGAVSEFARAFSHPRVRVLPNPGPPPAPVEPTGHPRVLYLGRFSEEKDLLTLLDAWGQVLRAVPDARLTFAGAGGSYRSIESELIQRIRSDAQLSATVEVVGWVSDPRSLLACHDVFAFPSLSEGMSNALIEAVASGRIVVASAITPNEEVLGPNYPLLFPPGHRELLVRALVLALRDEDIRKTALACVHERAELFAPDRIVDALEGIIDEATRRSRH